MAGEAAKKIVEVDAAAPPSTDVVIDLKKPVMANGEMVKKLTFREPTGGDMQLFGDKWPVNIDWQTGEVTPNPAVMANVMSTLAVVPPSTIKAMGGKDFLDVRPRADGFFRTRRAGDAILDCYRLARFFGQPPAYFLAMRLGEVDTHIDWVEKLLAVSAAKRPGG